MRDKLLVRHPALLLLAHAACFWPVWQWYFARMSDGSDEPWGVAALVAALVIGWPRQGLRLSERDPRLAWAAAITLAYAALVPFAPPMIRAMLAMGALACSWTAVCGTQEKLPAVAALLVLSVPVIASLQFYAGYPLRVMTAGAATALLDVFGMDIARVGTSMSSGGRTVLVDAPCSGVRMLWTGSVLACLLAAQRVNLRWRAVAWALLLVLPVVLAINGARAALLFLLETQPQPMPAWLHSLVGTGTFVGAALLLMASESWQSRWSAHHAPLIRVAAGTRT